ncbi:hypothetical protein BH23ACT10_BH23ACT10_15070 [soil metagenome]
MERVVGLAPHQLQGGQVVVEHQATERVEVVVQAGQRGALGDRKHQVVGAGVRDRRW